MDLWIVKHRPRSLDQFVWRDQEMRQTVEGWLKDRSLPHCLFSGQQGAGKTSLALLLLDLLEIPSEDLLKINASRERKIDELQDKIINFLGSWTFNATGLKYIFLDEADKLSQTAQGMLRNEMETYVNDCRFILTCNFPRQIIPPLHSRLQEIRFISLDKEEFALRAADVLTLEGVACYAEVLMDYVNATFPDLRKCLGMMQQNSRGYILAPLTDSADGISDHVHSFIKLFRAGQYTEGRKLLIQQANPDEYPDIFRILYQNLDLFGATESQQTKALLAIRDAARDNGVVADQEINLAACLAELAMIASDE
jgi:replication factor C small subunit